MSPKEQEIYLNGIRQRRLASIEAYKRLVEVRQKARSERLLARIDKESNLMEKELRTLERALEKVEKRAITLAALRLLTENS